MIVYCVYCGALPAILLETHGDDAWRIHSRSEGHQEAINEWAAARHFDGPERHVG